MLFLYQTTAKGQSSFEQKDSIVVYFFLLDECKISQYYTPQMIEIYQMYHSDLTQFVGIFPNFASKKKNIEKFREKYNIPFPLKTDYFKKQTKKFGTTILPEVVVYNKSKDIMLYKGRIDNAYVNVGKRRRVVTKSDLKDVLTKVVNNQAIEFYETTAIGCFINFNDNLNKNNRP